MSIDIIGKRIAAMRKERGVKQEELANYVGVSAQAVSKWENGGVPDTELLPLIADFFSVSVDHLFGRSITRCGDLQSAIMDKVGDTAYEQQFKQVFNYCWDMERAMMLKGCEKCSIEEYEDRIKENDQSYSSIITDYGFTRMGIANRLQYFLIVPEVKDTDAAFFNGIDYPSFFKDLSDQDVFNACVILHKRANKKAFTPNYLVKNSGLSPEGVQRALAILAKYGMIYPKEIELDDEVKTVYQFEPSPSFIALLIFAREIIDKPCGFSYYCLNRSKPYLK